MTPLIHQQAATATTSRGHASVQPAIHGRQLRLIANPVERNRVKQKALLPMTPRTGSAADAHH